METETISKNGVSLKDQMSRGNFLRKVCLALLMSYIGLCFISCNKQQEVIEIPISMSYSYSPFPSEGGTKDVVVTCEVAVEVSEYPDWITITKTGDTGEQTFYLTASKNESNLTRKDYVAFTTHKSKVTLTDRITVTQLGQ